MKCYALKILGLKRYINIAHRLTGWNAVKFRAEQLGLDLSEEHIKHITAEIKMLSDEHPLTLDDVDSILRRENHRLINEFSDPNETANESTLEGVF